MRHPTLAATLLLTLLAGPSLAQSAAEQQGHHLDQNEAPAATPAAPPEAPRGTGPSQGMMGGAGMMKMMGMMRRSGGDGMGGMDTIDHVEGRIAFLRTELKITDAQASAWNAFADALRTNAKALGELRASMMSQGSGSESLVDRLTLQEKWLSVRLEGIRAMKSALTNLAGSFSDEQKKTANEVLAPQVGLMPMMTGMMPMMQGGRMGSMPTQGK